MNPSQRLPILFALLLLIPGSLLPLRAQEFECTGIDGWLPVGSGQKGHTAFAAAADDKLLYLYSWGGPSGSGILSSWDGTAVRTLSTEAARVEYPQMVTYRGMPYLGGGNMDERTLKRWNGRAWESSGLKSGPYAGEFISSMIVYKDRLYVGSNVRGLTIEGIEEPVYLAVYDGTKWEPIVIGCDPAQWRPYITAMGIYNGALIVSGNFIWIEGAEARYFARFDGTNWRSIPALDGTRGAAEIIQFRDRLYFTVHFGTWPRIIEWDGRSATRTIADTSSKIPLLREWPVTRSLAVHNDRLYSFGTVDVPGPSGPLRRTSAAFDGSTWHPVSSVRQWAWPIEYRGKLYAHGLIESSCGTPMNNLAYYCDENSCTRISGSVYMDTDGDCTQDTTEPGIPRRIVEVTPGPVYTTTDAQGGYVQFVEPGTYSVATVPYLHWTNGCSNDRPGEVTITAGAGKHSEQDLAVAPIAGIHDLRVSIAGTVIRPGRATDFIIHYVNVGTEPVSGLVRFTYDPTVLSYDSSSHPARTATSGLVEWQTPTLQSGEEGTIVVSMTAATTIRAGRVICVDVDCSVDDVTEQILHDNHDEACITVIASYDPNDISVMPSEPKSGYLRATDTVLSYQVRFQNTGNDTAFRVVIRDTLDPSLDIPTISIGAASHPYTWRLEGQNILVITFDDIGLPDSGTSERKSHGIVKYRLHLNQDLAPRTEIRNRVGIYFDYNTVVMTNQVVSRTPESSSTPIDRTAPSSVRSYPRPARDLLYINGQLLPGSTMILHSIDGKIVSTGTASGSGHEKLGVSGLAAGVYLLQIETDAGRAIEPVVVAR